MKFQNIAIVGMGAIGGLFAGRLGRLVESKGIALSALARGDTLAALQSQGLVLHHAGGSETVPVRVSHNPSDLGPQDLVIVAVKAPSLPALAPNIAALCGPGTTVLVAMNGVPWWFFEGAKDAHGACAGLALQSVDPGGQLAQSIPAHRVVGCVVHAAAKVTSPAVVQHVMGQQLIIGEPGGGASARTDALQALLSDADFDTQVSTHIQQDILVQALGQYDHEPGIGPDRRHGRPNSGRPLGA